MLRHAWPALFISMCLVLDQGVMAADPGALLEATRNSVLTGNQGPGTRESGELVIAVGESVIADFGNRRRASLRAEDKAELAALGELRAWAMGEGRDLAALAKTISPPPPLRLLRSYLGTLEGDIQVTGFRAKQTFHNESRAFAILVIERDAIAVTGPTFKDLDRGFKEFLDNQPELGEAYYEGSHANDARADDLYLRQLRAEGIPSEAVSAHCSERNLENGGDAGNKNILAEAQRALSGGELDQARIAFLRSLQQDPLSVQANRGLAQVYLAAEMPRLARRFAERAFCGEGDRRGLYELYSEILQLNGEPHQAELARTLASKTSAGSPVLDDVLPDYQESVRSGRDRVALLILADGHVNLAALRHSWNVQNGAESARQSALEAFRRSRDTTEALALFLTAIQKSPFDAECLNYIAACYRSQKRFAGARLFADLAMMVDGSHRLASVNLALSLEELNAPSLALSQFQKANELGPKDSWSEKEITNGLSRLARFGSAGESK